ncbi:MAG: hypothetical protein ACHQIM_22380 [Sphingobacteriales bacterium]
MKSIISGAVIATAIIACLTLNVQAKSFNHVPAIAVSDTGKMANDKMKMDKMESRKMDKMAKSKMKAEKKMDKMKMSKKKMAKDTAGKM